MIGKKKLRDVQRDLTEILAKLPSGNSVDWFDREIQAAKGQPGRDLETLKMLKAALKRAAKKKRAPAKVRSANRPQRPSG